MSEELEWELFDVFEAGLFAFPLYEHQTARRIIRYLMYRGVLAEEIADAIEDSTTDLYVWLNRGGKNMVGEWVIAWVNDSRQEYKREKMREAREGGYSWVDHEDGEGVYSDSGSAGDSDGDGPPMRMRPQQDVRLKRIANIRPTSDSFGETSDEDCDVTECKVRSEVMEGLPPPLPPRTHEQTVQVDVEPTRSLRKGASIDTTSTDMYEPTPDSGAVSDIYSSIPPPTTTSDLIRLSHVTSSLIGLQQQDVSGSFIDHNDLMCSLIGLKPDVDDTGDIVGEQLERDQTRDLIGYLNDVDVTMNVIGLDNTSSTCSSESHINVLNSGLPTCPNCHCKISYYHLIQRNILIDSHSATTSEQRFSQTDTTDCTFGHSDQNDMLTDQEDIQIDPTNDQIDQSDNNNKTANQIDQTDNQHENANQMVDQVTNENEAMDTRTAKDEKHIRNGQLPQSEHTSEQYLNTRSDDHFIADIHLHTFERQRPGTQDGTSKAMEFNLQTLDRDVPGYIFIMTDSQHNFSPWSQAQRYKIASSRHPERWLLEFRSRRIEVDLIWQVKVKHHLRAVREVHAQLEQYNVQSNWYRCSLSTIMETISRVVRKYKP